MSQSSLLFPTILKDTDESFQTNLDILTEPQIISLIPAESAKASEQDFDNIKNITILI